MVVLHREDSLDNEVENLYVATRSELVKKSHTRNREKNNSKTSLFVKKIVSQFDLKGKYIATFHSIKEAAKATGANTGGITTILSGKRRRYSSGGYYWREGDDQTPIDLVAIQKELEKSKTKLKQAQSKQIIQFDLKGAYMDTYKSIKEASEKTGLKRDAITEVLCGRRYLSREYIWKYADTFENGNIPQQIIVVEKKLPELKQTAGKRKGKQFPRYDYPYEDRFLYDMEGEIWKEIPGLETYCMVSNLGRIKRVPCFVDRPNHGRYLIKEKIVKQNIRTFQLNPRVNIWNRALYFTVSIEGRITQMAVARAVYSAFVSPLSDFKEDKRFVLHKDLDSLNNKLENLYLATRKQMGKRNVKAGMTVPPNPLEFSDELWKKIKKIHSKPVSQYSIDGNYIASYSSIKEAGKKTGISENGINQVVKKKYKSSGNFIWRYGTDTNDLDKEALETFTLKKHYRAKAVNQYDLNGNLLASFASITEAARKTGVKRRNLNNHILRQTPEFKGYVWRHPDQLKEQSS